MDVKPGNAKPRLGRKKKSTAEPGLGAPSVRPDFENLVTNVTALAESMRGGQELAVAQYTPVVESILHTRCHDVRHIEHALDHLLDIAGHPDGLLLFRRLCRHYWDIAPAATAAYVNAYREMWDDEEQEVEP